MKDRMYEHNNNLADIEYELLEITRTCTVEELSCVLENVLHLTTMVMHNWQM